MTLTQPNNQIIDPQIIWHQVCQLYQADQVKSQCLRWQDGHNANVNLILILTILQQQNYQFTEAQLQSVLNKLKSFSEQTTGLIRKARFNWRTCSDNPEYQKLKQALLACELAFEQQEQRLIIEQFNQALKQNAGRDRYLSPASWYFKHLGIQAELQNLLDAFG